MWCKVSVQFHLFAYGNPIFPTLLVEKTILSLVNGFGNLVENHLTISVRVYFWALCSTPLVYVSVFIPVLQCFDYCSFVVDFEIGKCETSNLMLLFKNLFQE